MAVAPLGVRRYNDWYEYDGSRGFVLYGSPNDYSGDAEHTDCKLSDLGYITVTPVRVLCTDEGSLGRISATEWKV